MNPTIEDALVDWFETERKARVVSLEARRSDVVDLDQVRRMSPALERLFAAVEDVLGGMSVLQIEGAHRDTVEAPLRLVGGAGR